MTTMYERGIGTHSEVATRGMINAPAMNVEAKIVNIMFRYEKYVYLVEITFIHSSRITVAHADVNIFVI